MCTITLEYNQNSALARRKLAELLATGLFSQKGTEPEGSVNDEPTPEEIEARFHRALYFWTLMDLFGNPPFPMPENIGGDLPGTFVFASCPIPATGDRRAGR